MSQMIDGEFILNYDFRLVFHYSLTIYKFFSIKYLNTSCANQMRMTFLTKRYVFRATAHFSESINKGTCRPSPVIEV